MKVGDADISISRLTARHLRLVAGLAVVGEMLVRRHERDRSEGLGSEISVRYLVPRSTTTSSWTSPNSAGT